MLQELGTDEAFEKFGGRAEERDGAVGRREVKRLTRFRDREDKGVFPDSGDISRVKGEIEEGSEEGKGLGTEVFKMKVAKVIGAKGGGVFKEFDSVSGLLDSKGRKIGIKRAFMDGADNFTGKGILFMRASGAGVLAVKIFGNVAAVGESAEQFKE